MDRKLERDLLRFTSFSNSVLNFMVLMCFAIYHLFFCYLELILFDLIGNNKLYFHLHAIHHFLNSPSNFFSRINHIGINSPLLAGL